LIFTEGKSYKRFIVILTLFTTDNYTIDNYNTVQILGLVSLRAISSIILTSREPPSGGRAGLHLFTLQHKPKIKKTCTDNSSSRFDNLQHGNNYSHSDVDIVCRQPVCHYTAPLLGGISVCILVFIQ